MPPQNNQQFQGYGQQTTTPISQPMQDNSRRRKPNGLILAVVLGVLLLFAVIFGIWAFAGMQDYKNNSDNKSAAAVKVAEVAQAQKLEADFAEREKSPYKSYQSPADFGSVKVVYPKVWGAYVLESAQSGTPVDAYFHPGFVPDVASQTPIALRVQVASTSYSDSLKQYENQVQTGDLKASPFVPVNVKNVTGMRFDGQFEQNKKGSIIILPLRDKTLKIWTENPGNIGDLNSILLANLTFVP